MGLSSNRERSQTNSAFLFYVTEIPESLESTRFYVEGACSSYMECPISEDQQSILKAWRVTVDTSMTLCSDLRASLVHHEQVHLAIDMPTWCSIVLSARLGLGLQGCYSQDANSLVSCLEQFEGVCKLGTFVLIHSFIHSLISTPIHFQTIPNTPDILWQVGLLGRKDAEPISHSQLRGPGSQRKPL